MLDTPPVGGRYKPNGNTQTKPPPPLPWTPQTHLLTEEVSPRGSEVVSDTSESNSFVTDTSTRISALSTRSTENGESYGKRPETRPAPEAMLFRPKQNRPATSPAGKHLDAQPTPETTFRGLKNEKPQSKQKIVIEERNAVSGPKVSNTGSPDIPGNAPDMQNTVVDQADSSQDGLIALERVSQIEESTLVPTLVNDDSPGNVETTSTLRSVKALASMFSTTVDKQGGNSQISVPVFPSSVLGAVHSIPGQPLLPSAKTNPSETGERDSSSSKTVSEAEVQQEDFLKRYEKYTPLSTKPDHDHGRQDESGVEPLSAHAKGEDVMAALTKILETTTPVKVVKEPSNVDRLTPSDSASEEDPTDSLTDLTTKTTGWVNKETRGNQEVVSTAVSDTSEPVKGHPPEEDSILPLFDISSARNRLVNARKSMDSTSENALRSTPELYFSPESKTPRPMQQSGIRTSVDSSATKGRGSLQKLATMKRERRSLERSPMKEPASISVEHDSTPGKNDRMNQNGGHGLGKSNALPSLPPSKVQISPGTTPPRSSGVKNSQTLSKAHESSFAKMAREKRAARK